MKSPFIFRTRLTPDETIKRSKALVSAIKSTVLTCNIENPTQMHRMIPGTVERPLPVIVFLNGAGGSGKSTFASLVYDYALYHVCEKSTVDPIRDAVKILIEHSNNRTDDLLMEHILPAYKHGNEKTPEWRSLMHDVKIAWEKFDHGPIRYVFGEIVKTIMEKINCEDMQYSVIFVNVREKEAIQEMQELANDMGLLNFTMQVERVDPKTFDNEGDRNVDDIQYDIIIDNSGDIMDLRVKAFAFAIAVEAANRAYGVPEKEAIITRLDRVRWASEQEQDESE